jgi:hypothetical protein
MACLLLFLFYLRHCFTFRLEFDAYRNELDALQLGPQDSAVSPRAIELKQKFEEHKLRFEKMRADVNVKLKFLEENKVRVTAVQPFQFGQKDTSLLDKKIQVSYMCVCVYYLETLGLSQVGRIVHWYAEYPRFEPLFKRQ